ncbi:MAG: hypothetical protein ACRBCL_06230 [Maritimibacter sp.]
MFRATLFAIGLIAATNPLLADEVSDTLSSALEAYEEGDIDYAIEELDYAKQLLQGMKTEALTAFLPAAPDGWSREIDTEMNAGMAFLGGGVGASAEYMKGSESMSVTIMANNPMVTAFGGMIGNAAMLGMKVERVGREKFLWDDGELTGLIDNRIMIQIEAQDKATALALAEDIDFKALEEFGG